MFPGPKSLVLHPSSKIEMTNDHGFIDEQRAADWLDAMADREEEKRASMEEYFSELEKDESYWPEEEISKEEKYACDHYNERFVIDVW